jgi:Na+-transporting methylmalonyl-CoA/oxaloacetate decarboxylase gamma subunit
MTNLQTALQITLYGMGLVFIGILLLWGMMAAIVRIFSDRIKSGGEDARQTDASDDLDNKRMAVAIATATAIEMQNTSIQYSSHKERESISAWQAAHRSQRMNQNRTLASRKR